jgi:hypothetical protein
LNLADLVAGLIHFAGVLHRAVENGKYFAVACGHSC